MPQKRATTETYVWDAFLKVKRENSENAIPTYQFGTNKLGFA